MDIVNYLHLYIGSKFFCDYPTNVTEPRVLTGHLFETIRNCDNEGLCWNPKYVKLLLRPLSSMTEEEAKEIEATKGFQRPSPTHVLAMRVWTAESYRLALSKGFDLFGLIPAKLALDSTLVKTEK